jgi:hypothetical protein
VLGLSAKLYPRVLGLAATSDLRVIFIILIITLNLHDPSLSGFGCNTRPNKIGCRSGCKVVS